LDGLKELIVNMDVELDIQIGLSCVVPWGVGQTNAHQQYQQAFEDSDNFVTPVSIGQRESLMDATWEANGSAFKVIEERWKTVDENSQIVCKPGHRRVRNREIKTLRRLYKLAYFISTETFNNCADPVLELNIDGRDTIEINVRTDRTQEVTHE
jgi:hypothetical protein